MTAPLRLNRRMRTLLEYYADPYGAGKLAAVRQYRGQMTGTVQALQRRGLTRSIDVFPYTALTPAGVKALEQPRQDVPK